MQLSKYDSYYQRRKSPAERFWEKVDKNGPNGCWVWTAGLHKQFGYGQFWYNGINDLAHRMSWRLTYGEIPDGLNVCHKCDNPPCCNPDHLFLGTDLDNARDRNAKGRHNMPRGSALPHAKVTEAMIPQIHELRNRGLTHKQIGEIVGLGRAAVGLILNGKNWKHCKPRT